MALDKKKAAAVGQFVQFAYDMFDLGGLQPPPVKGIADAGYRLVYYLNAIDSLHQDNVDQKRFYGFIAVSESNPGDVVLAIRGTRGFQEWLLDFIALPVSFEPAPKKGFVALGFLAIFSKFEFIDLAGNVSTLSETIQKLHAANPIKTLTITGHSLGAALATLTAAELAFLNTGGLKKQLALYTFGSPRVGLADFAINFNKALKACVRIWNILDVVPQVAPFPYIHVSGFGERLLQTEEQLQKLQVNPVCEHIMPDYLWLLDPDKFPIAEKCTHADSRQMAALAGMEPQVAPGARALRRAMLASEPAHGLEQPVGPLMMNKLVVKKVAVKKVAAKKVSSKKAALKKKVTAKKRKNRRTGR